MGDALGHVLLDLLPTLLLELLVLHVKKSLISIALLRPPAPESRRLCAVSPCVGPCGCVRWYGALAADRQPASMARAAVATQVHQALDVHGHFKRRRSPSTVNFATCSRSFSMSCRTGPSSWWNQQCRQRRKWLANERGRCRNRGQRDYRMLMVIGMFTRRYEP